MDMFVLILKLFCMLASSIDVQFLKILKLKTNLMRNTVCRRPRFMQTACYGSEHLCMDINEILCR